MIFTRCRTEIDHPILTLQGEFIERVNCYKYMGIWLDDKLGFQIHIEKLLKKLRLKLGFLFRLKKCFHFKARKRIIQSCFLSVLDYGDVIYMHASLSSLKKLDYVYHAALRFVTSASSRTHHCILYGLMGWSSLFQRRKVHMLLFIVKALLGKLPTYICSLLSFYTCNYRTRSSAKLLLHVPRVHSELGKTAFSFFAPSLWNEMQSIIMLETLPSVNIFKNLLWSTMKETCTCYE